MCTKSVFMSLYFVGAHVRSYWLSMLSVHDGREVITEMGVEPLFPAILL